MPREDSDARSDWRGRHRDALADAHRHLTDHRHFGFGGKQ